MILHCGDRSCGGGREGGKELNSYNVMAACNGNLFFSILFLKNIYTSKKHIKGDITTLPCLLLMQGSTEVRRHRVGRPLGWRRFQSVKTKATYRVNWRFFFLFQRSIRLIMRRRRQREREKQNIEGVKQVKGWHKRASNRMLFSCVREVRVWVCVCLCVQCFRKYNTRDVFDCLRYKRYRKAIGCLCWQRGYRL